MNLKKLFRKSINSLEKTGSLFISEKDKKEAAPEPAQQKKETICTECLFRLPEDEFLEKYLVCPECGHHLRLTARQRLNIVSDTGSFTEHDANLRSVNFLEFPEYSEKLEQARAKTGEEDAVITGTCRISGLDAAVFLMEPNFIMGSMGSVVGEKITRLFEHATKDKLPVVGFCASGGARMQEGLTSLMQMAKTSAAVKRHSDTGLFYIAVLTHPTTGGVTASFAMEADVIVAEPRALIGFAGPRVIEGTIRKKLPDGFQRAETVLKQGFLDQIVNRRNIKAYLRRILSLHGGA